MGTISAPFVRAMLTDLNEADECIRRAECDQFMGPTARNNLTRALKDIKSVRAAILDALVADVTVEPSTEIMEAG